MKKTFKNKTSKRVFALTLATTTVIVYGLIVRAISNTLLASLLTNVLSIQNIALSFFAAGICGMLFIGVLFSIAFAVNSYATNNIQEEQE